MQPGIHFYPRPQGMPNPAPGSTPGGPPAAPPIAPVDPWAQAGAGPAPLTGVRPLVGGPRPGWGPRLTAVVVKSDGGEFAVSCVRSLRREWAASGYSPARLEVVVVQNPTCTDERASLATLAQEGALVLETGAALHMAAAVEYALQYSQGDEDDLVAVLSPFLVFLPGSVGRMVEYMAQHPECGLLGPRCYFDEGKAFQHPCLPLPGVGSEAAALRGLLSGRAGRRIARSRSEDNAEWWSVREPLETEMLGSGCLLVSRGFVIEQGFLFDTSYPHGFEDADLCRRVRASGRWVVYLPKAEVVLHGLPVDTTAEAADLWQRYEVSRRTYLARHGGWLERRWLEWLERRAAARGDDPAERPIHALGELGGHARPFELELPPPGDWILELSGTPQWNHSIGTLALAGPWRFPQRAWDRLAPGRHYLRVVDLANLEVACAYRFDKLVGADGRPVPVSAPGQVQPTVHQHWPDQRATG